MSTELYRYTRRPGEFIALTATMSVPSEAAAVVTRNLLAALYEAAGLPVPIVLDRVDEDAFSEWFSVERPTFLGRVLLDPRTPLDFVGARRYAAALAGAVERAESEPDPADVEALARVIRSSGWTGEDAARAILTRYTLTERKS